MKNVSILEASGQDGGIGRHTMPPRTTKRTTTTKKMAQMTQHFKAPEIIQLSSEQIANLSDA